MITPAMFAPVIPVHAGELPAAAPATIVGADPPPITCAVVVAPAALTINGAAVLDDGATHSATPEAQLKPTLEDDELFDTDSELLVPVYALLIRFMGTTPVNR